MGLLVFAGDLFILLAASVGFVMLPVGLVIGLGVLCRSLAGRVRLHKQFIDVRQQRALATRRVSRIVEDAKRQMEAVK